MLSFSGDRIESQFEKLREIFLTLSFSYYFLFYLNGSAREKGKQKTLF
jgi:hypothetical protein